MSSSHSTDRFIEPLEIRRLLAVYYVSGSGNDANDGRSPATAWRTIERANGRNWNPGDRLLFEGGQTFTPAGSPGPELLSNGGFESGLDAWSDTMGSSPANSAVTFDTSNTGFASLQLSGSGAAARAQDLTASLVGNQAYKVNMNTRVENPGSGIRRIGVTFSFAGENVATFYRGFRDTNWNHTEWAFVAPPVFDKATFWVSRSGDTSTVFVDDLSIHSVPNGLVFDHTDSGTVEHPFIIASYGTGKAIFDVGDGIGLWGSNVSGMQVQNLIFRGSWDATNATGGNAGVGIEFVNTRNDNSKLEFITIEKCEVSGFQWAGARVGGWAGKSGFRTVLITDSLFHKNGDFGVHIRGEFDRNSTLYANEKVFIARSKAYDNTGVPDRGSNSGSGFLISDTAWGTVERCVAHHNGALNNSEHGGPFGIWAFDATKISLQYSESFSNKTGSSRDGGGFDFDSGVTNSVMQNNYSHDNDGPGYLLGQFHNARPWGRNIVRHNISQNDARKNAYGAITLSGAPGPYNVIIENNTVYTSPSPGATVSGVRLKWTGTGVNFRNNVIQTTGGVTLVDADSQSSFTQFNGNAYWTTGGTFRIRWSGTNYSSLEAWRSSTGQEIYANEATGLFVDPALAAPGTAGHLNNAYKLPTLTQYDLLPNSPLIRAGVNLPAPIKGYTPSLYDFFGRTLIGRAQDVGAAEVI